MDFVVYLLKEAVRKRHETMLMSILLHIGVVKRMWIIYLSKFIINHVKLKIVTPIEKTEQLSEEFDRTGKCQTCEDNNLEDDYSMCPQMVYDTVKFHIEEILELLNSLDSKEDIEKAKKFYSDCLNVIPF